MSTFSISFSLATKLIGSIGLAISILMINLFTSAFMLTNDHERFLTTIESWTLFGLNWTRLVKNVKSNDQATFLLIFVLAYCACFVSANLLLCSASIKNKPQLVLPWVYLQLISIIDQSIAITIRWSCADFNTIEKPIWDMSASTIYLILSAYFLIVICAARKEWINSPQNCTSTIPRLNEILHGSNVPKSPSYLAEQNLYVQPPRPLVLAKHK